jgi:hypothetical protein
MLTTTNETPTGNEYPVSIDGDIIIVLDSETETKYFITVKELTDTDFTATVPKSELPTSEALNPGDIFRWLLKKLKETICPECL